MVRRKDFKCLAIDWFYGLRHQSVCVFISIVTSNAVRAQRFRHIIADKTFIRKAFPLRQKEKRDQLSENPPERNFNFVLCFNFSSDCSRDEIEETVRLGITFNVGSSHHFPN